jgi:hypothetical protein
MPTADRSPARLFPLVAAALLALSLGFPWAVQSGSESIYSPGAYIPGSCVNVTGFDGYMSTECTPGQVLVGLYFPGSDGTIVSGRMHPGRFALVGGMVLVAIGLRTGNRRYFGWAGASVAVISVLTGGLAPFTSGVMVAMLASITLLVSSGFGVRQVSTVKSRRR